MDLIPYGQAVTAADLGSTDLVVALPVADYPSTEGDPAQDDEAWSQGEIAALEAYVTNGGLLVLTNSEHRLKYTNTVMDLSEDRSDANALAERFGVTYGEGMLAGNRAQPVGQGTVVEGVTFLDLAVGNGVLFGLTEAAKAQVLAAMDGQPVVALVDYGQEQLLALADLGILGADWGGPGNLPFWRNLARYARSR